MSKNGSTKYFQRAHMSADEALLVRQSIAGANLIKYYSDTAPDDAGNDKMLTAMSVALVMALKEKPGNIITDDMGVVIGLAMLAACEYGRSQDK